jgi:hypothetical protein
MYLIATKCVALVPLHSAFLLGSPDNDGDYSDSHQDKDTYQAEDYGRTGED